LGFEAFHLRQCRLSPLSFHLSPLPFHLSPLSFLLHFLLRQQNQTTIGPKKA
jgi:hypothetical protein